MSSLKAPVRSDQKTFLQSYSATVRLLLFVQWLIKIIDRNADGSCLRSYKVQMFGSRRILVKLQRMKVTVSVFLWLFVTFPF